MDLALHPEPHARPGLSSLGSQFFHGLISQPREICVVLESVSNCLLFFLLLLPVELLTFGIESSSTESPPWRAEVPLLLLCCPSCPLLAVSGYCDQPFVRPGMEQELFLCSFPILMFSFPSFKKMWLYTQNFASNTETSPLPMLPMTVSLCAIKHPPWCPALARHLVKLALVTGRGHCWTGYGTLLGCGLYKLEGVMSEQGFSNLAWLTFGAR